MLGLFEFFRSGKMIYFILCLIALYMALRFVFFYYIPTALNFVTMYFIHSIMVCLTIFFAVPLNNSVEMSDNNTDIQVAEPIKEKDIEAPELLSKEPSAPLLTQESPQYANTTNTLLQPPEVTSSASEQLTKLEPISQNPSAPSLSEITPTTAAASNPTAASIADSNPTSATTAAVSNPTAASIADSQ
jgi:hypothetical protein